MKATGIVVFALMAWTGCSQKKTADAPAPQSKKQPPTAAVAGNSDGTTPLDEPAEPVVASEPVDSESDGEPPVEPAPTAGPTAEQNRVAGVMAKLFCHHKRDSRTGLAEIYAKAGFKDAADVSAAWADARATDERWAERVMAEMQDLSCTAPVSP